MDERIVQIDFRVRTICTKKQPAIRSTFAFSVRLFDFSHDHDRTIRPLVFNNSFYYHYISLFYQFLHDRREGFAKDLKVRVSICFLLFFPFSLIRLFVAFVVKKDRSVEKSSGLRILRRKYESCGDLLDRTVFYRWSVDFVSINVTGCNSWRMVDKFALDITRYDVAFDRSTFRSMRGYSAIDSGAKRRFIFEHRLVRVGHKISPQSCKSCKSLDRPILLASISFSYYFHLSYLLYLCAIRNSVGHYESYIKVTSNKPTIFLSYLPRPSTHYRYENLRKRS